MEAPLWMQTEKEELMKRREWQHWHFRKITEKRIEFVSRSSLNTSLSK